MEKVAKVYFDPLLSERDQIQAFVKSLAIGSAHPFQGCLLVHTKPGVVEEVDISMHSEDYFSNAVSLGDLGEGVLDRMKSFTEISKFNDEFTIQPAPGATCKIPIINDEIHIFAVSKKTPSYYDLCIADSNHQTACYGARKTFTGLAHSGDIDKGNMLLQHIKISSNLDEMARAVFVSGFQYNKLKGYKAYNPVVLIVNHKTKVLYVVPVPLDEATIGNATLCSPLVIKKDRSDNTLFCSILANPGVDEALMCSGASLPSPSFATAIERAIFVIDEPQIATTQPTVNSQTDETTTRSTNPAGVQAGANVILATPSAILPKLQDASQIIRFGKSLKWVINGQVDTSIKSLSVLPCILGGVLEGPLLLATGEGPLRMPFQNMLDLHQYYKRAKSILVIVDENMTDNARTLATHWRLNGLFIVQKSGQTPDDSQDVTSLLEKLNINAITALAGPLSLILAQLGSKYYFYRGVANPQYMDTSDFKFGLDVTELMTRGDVCAEKLFHPSWPRLVNLDQNNPIYLPKNGEVLQLDQLENTFHTSSLNEIRALRDDIITMIPQLQAILSQEKLQELCSALINLVEQKLAVEVDPLKKEYALFITRDYNINDLDSQKKKNKLLGDLRKLTREARDDVQWLIQALGNIVSTQTTSTKTHDLKRIIRQTAIKSNVDKAKSLNFEKLALLLEEHAEQLGVLIVNVDTQKYQEYLQQALYMKMAPAEIEVCSLDSRTIYLEGLDAGIILEQSQSEHEGPLVSQLGSRQPIMALSTLNQRLGPGSMLAWVCWDEFVKLQNPYSVRWMEKCNDPHIAALRIIMRSTLSDAVSTREIGLKSSDPATGQLMASLLMSAMLKLAATRNSPPTIVTEPEDTSTLLMRGLFGNLLTIAGSGVKPLSFIWQLFGQLPQFEVPTTRSEWDWYEVTTKLLPFSGWPIEQFQKNLIGLLDKVIFKMITKNEKMDIAKNSKLSLADYCKLRNIQLLHSRTIITILKKMLTEQGDCQDAAARLLTMVPATVENETESYRRLYRYITHLANGGKQRTDDNLIAANVFTKRSAIFGETKKALTAAARDGNKIVAIELCKQILTAREEVEISWGLEKDTVTVQCIDNIKALLETYQTGTSDHMMVRKLKGDSEQKRKAWQIGEGKSGTIEEIDMEVVNYVLDNGAIPAGVTTKVAVEEQKKSPFGEFEKSTAEGFLRRVEAAASLQDVSTLLGISPAALGVFAAFLEPQFNLDRLPENFRSVVLSLLRDRNRDAEKVKPTKMLFKGGLIEG